MAEQTPNIELEKRRAHLTNLKKQMTDFIENLKIEDDGRPNADFAFFGFVAGQPVPVMTMGVDKDIFGVVASDFVNGLTMFEKEMKINSIKDESLRSRLLMALRKEAGL